MGSLKAGFVTRRKADAALIERYEWDARYHGDSNIKNELATAKRTATSISKSLEQFKHLRPEHQLALDAARSAMRKLAADLTELCAWAKEYREYCVSEFAKERAAELEAVALKRWGNDEKAMLFEVELIRELITTPGREAFGRWMHTLGKQLEVEPKNFRTHFDHIHSIEVQRDASKCRQVMAGVIDDASHSFGSPRQADKYQTHYAGKAHLVYSCSFKEYEQYLAHRIAQASTVNKLLSMMPMDANDGAEL